ncbi:hypothetical protein [Pseudomonas panipatensis]|uniref:Lipoprotein n=1 Tax=Pseudomonas panipatensis TaxID=428992 RepID=A0A1G8L449_9PSED|nr:hypothetical protein [Pseudomonas panipatensis]SDI50452.1 hypothetical protein SAMN05216272_110140 [Pseudomonas panipatensis]SMP72530.1 hypothetical protein SAMN06295951_11130 [Pseudomonas panipatensis]
MRRHLIPPILLAACIAIGGSSCHDYGSDSGKQPPAADNPRSGYQMVPSQQIQPRVQSLPMPGR